jgi:hypothetical protein
MLVRMVLPYTSIGVPITGSPIYGSLGSPFNGFLSYELVQQ